MKQNLEPNPNVLCDFPSCNSESTSQIIWLACFHTCHLYCLERNKKLCPICKDPFPKRVHDLSDSFNKGFLENDTSSNIVDSHNSHEQPESQPDINTSRNAYFYKSHDCENTCMITRNLEQLIIPLHNQVFHMEQLKRKDILKIGLLPLQIHDETTVHTVGKLATENLVDLALPDLTYYNHTKHTVKTSK